MEFLEYFKRYLLKHKIKKMLTSVQIGFKLKGNDNGL